MMKTQGVHHELLVRECSMQEARGERPMDLRESVRVLQVFPFPATHYLHGDTIGIQYLMYCL